MSFQEILDDLRYGGPEIRIRAAHALGHSEDTVAIEPLLEALDDPSFTTELGQHNIELNVPPRPLAKIEAELKALEGDIVAMLGEVMA